MKQNLFRISVRFNLNNPEHAEIVSILKNLNKNFHTTENAFIIEALTFYIRNMSSDTLTGDGREVNGKRAIAIDVVELPNNYVRVSVFNTGKNFTEDEMKAIWGRFYKVDTSRNRENGGTGIGLSFVKAVMNNYKQKYGVKRAKSPVFKLWKD